LHPIAAKNITVNWEKIEKFIFGENVEQFPQKAKTILTALGFQVHENTITPALRR
jgi:hypothetical protein